MGFFLRAFHGGTVAGHGELINMNIHADGQYARGWANCCMGCIQDINPYAWMKWVGTAQVQTTLNRIFSFTYYLDLQNPISFYYQCKFCFIIVVGVHRNRLFKLVECICKG